jgi:hypothetical protein
LAASVLLSAALFIAKTKQQCFKLIKSLLLIGSDRLDQDTVAAIPSAETPLVSAAANAAVFRWRLSLREPPALGRATDLKLTTRPLVARHKSRIPFIAKKCRDEPADGKFTAFYRGVGAEESFARSKSLMSTARLFGTMPEPNLRA